MKKVLLVTLEHPPQIGGIATYCHDLAAALGKENVVVLAPAGKDKYATQAEKLAWDKEQPYKIVRKRMLLPKFIWPRWILLGWQLWRTAKEENCQIVFVQHVLPVGYAAIFTKIIGKIPFLLFSHGTDLVAGTANWWKKKMVTMVSEHSEEIIFNSESLKRRFLRVLSQFESKSLVLYPCPEPAFLEPPNEADLLALRAQYALEGKKVLLSISRLTDGKGFPHLINIMPEVLKKNPNLVWFIVGDGPKKNEIIKHIRENNLQNIVRFIGEIPHIALHQYYYLADLFVLLTHPDEGKEEGLGLVFLEASAAGLPIVAGKSGGVEEAVLDKQTGLVVDTHNGTEVAEAILGMLENEGQAKQFGNAAKNRIINDFNWPKQVAKLGPWLK